MQHSGPMPPSDRPTHRRHLASDGLTPWRLRREHRALFRGVYVSRKALVDIWLLAQAALVTAGPGAFVSHHSAAALWEGAVPDHPDVHITYRKNRARAAGIAAHRLKADQEVVQLRGLPVTTPVQTFLDMSHALSLVDLVVLGDSLVRRGRCTPGQLVDAAERRAGPYSRLARRAARLVRAHVDSPMETRTRLLIVFAGLPEPSVNLLVHGPDGEVLRRFDLGYAEWCLVIEYDGRQHAESIGQWHSDISRDEQLDDWGVRRLVIVAADIYRTPATTLARITKAMRNAGMPVPPLKEEWRRHFPSRPGDLERPW